MAEFVHSHSFFCTVSLFLIDSDGMIAAMLMISFDDEDGLSIYRIDGYYRGVKVCAIFDLLEDLSSFRCGFEEKSCQKQTIRNANL